MKKKILKNDNPILSGGEKTQGALFLAISLAAIFSVAVLVYLKMNYSDVQTEVAVQVLPEGFVGSEQRMAQEIDAKLPSAKGEMLIPRLSGIEGKWFTTFGTNSIVEITIADGLYELIYTNDSQGRYRQYSRGKYKYVEKNGRITLYPSSKMGAPDPVAGATYKNMTTRHYEIYLKRNEGDDSLYFLAPDYQIKAKRYHPLFIFADFDGAPVLKFSPIQVGQ